MTIALYPDAEQIQTLLTGRADQPIAMLNLLRFKPRGDAPDEDVSGEDAFVMLLRRDRFADFTRKEICDTSRYTEGLFALSCESRVEVDTMLKTAIAEGAKEATDPQDHGFMYVRTFYDLDGHHWEIMWMDPAAIPQ
jgi:predicted lactoylglutathione lyase